MPDKDKESLEQQKQAQKAFKEAEKNAKRKEREEAEANSMPGYTKAQKTNRRLLIFFLILVFVLLIFVPIYGVARKNAREKKQQPLAVSSTQVQDPQKDSKMKAMKLATLRYAGVEFTGNAKDYSFETIDDRNNTIVGETKVKIKGDPGYFRLVTIFSQSKDETTTHYVYLRGELNGQQVQQLVMNDGKYNNEISSRKRPTVGQNMKTS